MQKNNKKHYKQRSCGASQIMLLSQTGMCYSDILFITFLVRRDESPKNYCHSPSVVAGVVVVVVVRRQKL